MRPFAVKTGHERFASAHAGPSAEKSALGGEDAQEQHAYPQVSKHVSQLLVEQHGQNEHELLPFAVQEMLPEPSRVVDSSGS